MEKIYFAHSHTDETFARQLSLSLIAMGAGVWLDQDEIEPAETPDNVMQRGLDACQAMIVIISPDSMASPDVPAGWQSYRVKQKPMVPILLHATHPIPPELNRYVDFQQQPYEAALAHLYVELLDSGVKVRPPDALAKKMKAVPPKPTCRSCLFTVMFVTICLNSIFLSSKDILRDVWPLLHHHDTPYLVRQFDGHELSVDAVAYSPDGRYFVTGDWDNTAKLWDIEKHKVIHTFSGHTGWVTNVAFSPDGQSVLTVSWADDTAKLWDVETGQLITTFWAEFVYIHTAAFSPDGRTVVTAGFEGTITLWDVATGQLLRSFTGDEETIWSVAFSPDGAYLVTGYGNGLVQVWDVVAGQVIRSLGGHADSVNNVAFSPNRRYILTGSDDGTAKLWDVASGLYIRTFGAYRYGVTGIAFSPDGRYVAIVGVKRAKLWDVESGDLVRVFHIDDVLRGVAFSPDSRYIVTGGLFHSASLWKTGIHTVQ